MASFNLKTREYVSDASLLFASIIWGCTYVIVKQTLETVPAFAFLTMRFSVAAALLLIISHRKFNQFNIRVIKDGSTLGTLLFLSFALQTLGLKQVSSSVTAFITGLYVVFVPIFSSVLLKKKPPTCSLIGILLSCTGLALITLKEKLALSGGELLVLTCSVFCSLHIILTDRYSRRNNVFLLTTVQILVALVLSCAISLVSEPFALRDAWNVQLISAVIITGVFATVITFLIMMEMQKHTTPAKAAIIYMMEPVSSIFFGYFIGGELMTTKQHIGALLIIGAMLVAEAGTYMAVARKKPGFHIRQPQALHVPLHKPQTDATPEQTKDHIAFHQPL